MQSRYNVFDIIHLIKVEPIIDNIFDNRYNYKKRGGENGTICTRIRNTFRKI